MVNEITIPIVFILIIMDIWWAELLDIKGAFLTGIFDKGGGYTWKCHREWKKSTIEYPVTFPENIIWTETSCCTVLEIVTEII